MDLTHLPIKKTALNPLWIISIFFSFTETMLGYAVFNTQGGVQITLTVFVIAFPTFVATMFFIILWCRPKHLYAPTDYQTDKSFLDSFIQPKTADKLSRQIEKTVNESLTSDKIIRDLKGTKKTEDVLKETAEAIVNKIKQDNFITVDISKFTRSKNEVLTLSYDDFKTFNDLTNQVYFKLRSASYIPAFSYGYEWLLKHGDTGNIIVGARMITGTAKGEYLDDKRTLEELGIKRGTKLIADKPNTTA